MNTSDTKPFRVNEILRYTGHVKNHDPINEKLTDIPNMMLLFFRILTSSPSRTGLANMKLILRANPVIGPLLMSADH